MTEKSRIISGFALVELLILVVIIGILASITLAYYTGTNQHKPVTIKQKAIASTLQSDLANASTSLKLYFVDHDQYPEALDKDYCVASADVAKLCLKISKGNIIMYDSSDPYDTYSIAATDETGAKYILTDSSAPIKVSD